MFDLLSNLWMGATVALTPMNILLCLVGATVGTLIGVLPGIGSLATIAMLLPITFGLPPGGALIMLARIYYGAQDGEGFGVVLRALGTPDRQISRVLTLLADRITQRYAGSCLVGTTIIPGREWESWRSRGDGRP